MKTAFHIKAVCAVLLIGSALPAVAQQAVGRPALDPSLEGTRVSSSKDAAEELARYARCVVAQRYDRVRAMVLAPYGSKEQIEAADKVTQGLGDSCLKGGFDLIELRVRPDYLAGSAAQAMVLAEYPDLPAVIQSIAFDDAAERERAVQLGATERFGRCLVRRDSAAVQALLSAAPASDQERQAVSALKEDMGWCLAEGSTLRITQMFLRNVTAVAAYRLAQEVSPRSRKRASAARAGARNA